MTTQTYKHFFQMTKEEFFTTYQLTTEDKKAINDSINRFGFSQETAKGLRLQKVYEDSRWNDTDEIKNLEKHLQNLSISIASSAPDYSKKMF